MPARFDEVAAYIMAWGRSSRMGQDKALLEINGVPMLQRTATLLAAVAGKVTVIGPPGRYERFGLPVIRETELPISGPKVGPVRGILTALRHTESSWNLIVACDMPYLTEAWLHYLVSRAAASPANAVIANGLCVMFHRRSAEPIHRALTEGAYKFSKAMAYLSCDYVTEEEIAPFDVTGRLLADMDTPEEYQQARGTLETDCTSSKSVG